jgi:hypothetical protein
LSREVVRKGKANRGKIQAPLNELKNMKNDSNSNPLNDGGAKPCNHRNGAEKQSAQPKPISEARLRANQNNAKKSTGPKTAQGKAWSRRNALKHGILSKTILFEDDGTPINDELHELRGQLRVEYGEGNPRVELLIETIVVEWYRQHVALQCELACCRKNVLSYFSPGGHVQNVQRYRSASQRALFKSLDELEELQPAQLPAEGNGDEPEVDPGARGLEAVLQTPGETSGEGAVISEKGEPESGAVATGSEGEVAA